MTTYDMLRVGSGQVSLLMFGEQQMSEQKTATHISSELLEVSASGPENTDKLSILTFFMFFSSTWTIKHS